VARRALFPLIVIVLLVYLASQTLFPTKDRGDRIAYGDLIERVDRSPETVEEVVFVPRSNGIRVTLRDGSKLETNYPTKPSQLEFQHLLRDRHVHFESRGTGDSAWWSIMTYLLPFALFVGFWIFLTSRVRARRADEAPPDLRARDDQAGGTSRYWSANLAISANAGAATTPPQIAPRGSSTATRMTSRGSFAGTKPTNEAT
jgi:ATP-dependent Zn protease